MYISYIYLTSNQFWYMYLYIVDFPDIELNKKRTLFILQFLEKVLWNVLNPLDLFYIETMLDVDPPSLYKIYPSFIQMSSVINRKIENFCLLCIFVYYVYFKFSTPQLGILVSKLNKTINLELVFNLITAVMVILLT